MRAILPATAEAFAVWLSSASRPHVAELTAGQLVIDGKWAVMLREHGRLFAQVWNEHGAGRLLWTREPAVPDLIRRTRVASWEWVRCAETAWRVRHSVKGSPMPETRAALANVLADQGSAHFALDATRLESILAATTARGAKVDEAAMAELLQRMARTHRQLLELLGFDPLPDENAPRTLAWLRGYGMTVDGISSDEWASRSTDGSPLAAEAEAAYDEALWLRRRMPKVRELHRATKRGKVHSRLRPFAQVSGRISSTGPALNNVAKDLRHLLVANSGHVLVTADFDGVEPRVLAGLSGDAKLAADLADGDPYADAAERADLDRVTSRNPMKIVMLASMYGATAGRTARQLGVTLARAQGIRAALWEPYPVAREWLDANRGLQATTLDSGRPMGVVAAEHARPNLVVQSTAYDIFQAAVLRVHDALPKGAHIWLTMHDEVVVECPERLTARVVSVLAAHMQSECRGVPIHATPVVLGTHWKKV